MAADKTPCTWSPSVDKSGRDPHTHIPYQPYSNRPNQLRMSSILDNIGYTPLVRLNKIPQSHGIACDVYAKCEFFNAGGSVKDRIGKRMVEEAERQGLLKPGVSTVIEPTSGNTGIGLALACAVKGYKAIITMPEKMSQEKVDVLKALGAEIVRTPTEAAWDSPESHISVAKRLNEQIPDSIILDQYSNPYNPIAHYDGTAEEILEACEGKVDMIVAGAGTGGTITGIAKKIRERCPECVIVGVDPHGSILAQPEELNAEGGPPYKVEGIGYDFIPRVLERNLVDRWYKSNDHDSFHFSRRLIRDEGILCGGSSGSAMSGVVHAAKDLKPGQKCVVLFADSVRNYMTKFLNDDWMAKNGFTDSDGGSIAVESPISPDKPIFDFGSYRVKDLELPQAVSVSAGTPCTEAVEVMQQKCFDQLPVIQDQSTQKLVGLVTLGNILSKVSHGKATMSDPVSKIMFKFPKDHEFKEINADTLLSDLSRFFDTNSAAIVTESGKMVIKHVVTSIDLVTFMMKSSK